MACLPEPQEAAPSHQDENALAAAVQRVTQRPPATWANPWGQTYWTSISCKPLPMRSAPP
ncbi:MAG: hypothetical protein HC860_01885 [Alkalinema sp. RU_4_3]|nr:hypothetical protein [Alkalinema sp. RU_4_3]